MDGNEAVVVHIGEQAHDELAVHSVSNTTMTGNGFSKVLNFERPFQPRGEEAAEWSNKGGKGRKDKNVELDWGDVEGLVDVSPFWHGVWLCFEARVWSAFETRKEVGAQIVDWASEIFVLLQEDCCAIAEYNCAYPSADKALDGFLRGEFDQLGPAECDSTDVGKDIICNHKRYGDTEPDQPFEDVV